MGDRERLGESEFGVMKQQCQGMIYERLLSLTLPSLRQSRFKYHISEKFNSGHAQSDQCTISRNWIALFV